MDDHRLKGVQCDDLVVQFGGQRILDRLSLQVEPGEIVSLLGASGCGKSTLLRTIAHLTEPHSGTVRFGGGNPSKDGSESQRPSMSFVFQDATLLPWRTVSENVGLPLELSGETPSTSTKARIDHWLTQVGLTEKDGRKLPSELSGGMRMRASLARAMVTDPDILLLDEPFAALDDMLRGRLNELVHQIWKEKNRTILFVTHNISEAVYLSHRVALLSEGRIIEEIPLEHPIPRDSSFRSSSEFAGLYGRVLNSLGVHAA